MHELLDTSALNITGVRRSGSLTEDDYHAVAPFLKDKAERYTTTRFCFVLEDVDPWDEDSLWSTWALDVRHTRGIDKIAVVSDAPPDAWMEKIALIFPAALVRTFAGGEEDAAWTWLRGTPHADDPAEADAA